jgi:GR25 family glycosyltransferase involved in LPS biosynthesis
MKHYYKNLSGENWFDYEGLYSEMVEKFSAGAHFVEVGTWKGRSACYMAVEIINSGKNIKFDCVDTWQPVPTEKDIPEELYKELYGIFLANIEPVKQYIKPVQSLSWEGANRYEDKSLDFVFIDAAHDYASVKKDLEAWYPKIKPGGIIAGHDYRPDVGVFSAVNDFFKEKENVTTKGSCWFVSMDKGVTFDSYKNFKAYVINLDRERWRFGQAYSNLSYAGFTNIIRWKAADYKELDVNEEFRHMGATRLERFHNDGEVACALSHYRIWADFLSGNDPYCLVFEDDVVAGSNFEQISSFPDLRYDDFDLLSLGGILLDTIEPDGSFKVANLEDVKKAQGECTYISKVTACQSHAYLISRKGAYAALHGYRDCLTSDSWEAPTLDHYLYQHKKLNTVYAGNWNIPELNKYRLVDKHLGRYGFVAPRMFGILYQDGDNKSTIQNY